VSWQAAKETESTRAVEFAESKLKLAVEIAESKLKLENAEEATRKAEASAQANSTRMGKEFETQLELAKKETAMVGKNELLVAQKKLMETRAAEMKAQVSGAPCSKHDWSDSAYLSLW